MSKSLFVYECKTASRANAKQPSVPALSSNAGVTIYLLNSGVSTYPLTNLQMRRGRFAAYGVVSSHHRQNDHIWRKHQGCIVGTLSNIGGFDFPIRIIFCNLLSFSLSVFRWRVQRPSLLNSCHEMDSCQQSHLWMRDDEHMPHFWMTKPFDKAPSCKAPPPTPVPIV